MWSLILGPVGGHLSFQIGDLSFQIGDLSFQIGDLSFQIGDLSFQIEYVVGQKLDRRQYNKRVRLTIIEPVLRQSMESVSNQVNYD